MWHFHLRVLDEDIWWKNMYLFNLKKYICSQSQWSFLFLHQCSSDITLWEYFNYWIFAYDLINAPQKLVFYSSISFLILLSFWFWIFRKSLVMSFLYQLHLPISQRYGQINLYLLQLISFFIINILILLFWERSSGR